ncbi:MAG TPA: hypothetical protein VGG10_05210 [Rhizomicrobium sp.]|jgi:hypothetical protein
MRAFAFERAADPAAAIRMTAQPGALPPTLARCRRPWRGRNSSLAGRRCST